MRDLSRQEAAAYRLYCGTFSEMAKHLGLKSSNSLPGQFKQTCEIRSKDECYGIVDWQPASGGEEIEPLEEETEAQQVEADPRRVAEMYQRQNKSLRKQLEKARQMNAVVADAIAANVSPIKLLKYPKRTKGPGVDHAIFALLSDVHVGEWVRGDETAGLSEYNYDIFRQRRDRYLEAFSNALADFRRAYKADHLYILGLGDWVTGEDIFPKQPTRIDLMLREQVMAGAQEMGRLILAMARQFTSTHCFFQWGNHGQERFTTNNNDIMCYQWIQALLKEQESIYINVSPARFNAFTLGPQHGPLDFGDIDKTYEYLLLHGQEAKRYMGFPWYGVDRAIQRSNRMVGMVYRRAFLGHHHQAAAAPGWVANGSWPGGTEFSIGEMQGCARPSQQFLSFAPEYGVGWNLELYMDDAPKLRPPDEHGARIKSLDTPSLEGDTDVVAARRPV